MYQSIARSSSSRNVTSVTSAAARTSPRWTRASALPPWCVRPDRRRSVSRAAVSLGGLPQISTPVDTSVSQPMTSSSSPPSPAARAPATALRRAFSEATASGAPLSSSRTSTGRSVKASPRSSRILRRCGELLARTSCIVLELGEPDADLALGRLGRIGPVDEVLADLDRVVTADRARGGLERVGRADELAGGLDDVLALEHGGDERRRGDEVDELAEERPLGVLGVVRLGRLARRRHELEGDDAQALGLEALEDLAGQAARERVRLDQD